MSSESRSVTGCWTCKLRKKKCDELKPTCQVCRGLGLDCSGYGLRPHWMDAAMKEQHMLARIRTKVKEITSQKKRSAMQQRQQTMKHREIGNNSYQKPPMLGLHTTVLSSSDFPAPKTSHQAPEQSLLLDELPRGLKFDDTTDYSTQTRFTLLMHYLDNVFPCQFRFYRPALQDGGRGWLLSLLMQTKPLYLAACSKAAYHQQMIQSLTGRKSKPYLANIALHCQYNAAITELRKYLQEMDSCGRTRTLLNNVQLLSSMIIVISTEAFLSKTEAWQIHLTAATALYPDISKQLLREPLKSHTILNISTALSFFASTSLWYDIFSCATTGSIPFDLRGTEIEKYIDFKTVMGCENWVMFAIRDIASLAHWKNSMKVTGRLSMQELINRANSIETRLYEGLEESLKDVQRLKENFSIEDGGLFRYDHTYINTCVTRVYICSAFVYLHVTTSGAFPKLVKIRQSVARAIEAFKGLPDTQLLNSLIWPLCISGCMSSDEDKHFFRGLSRSANPTNSAYGAAKAHMIFEECWRLRGIEPDSGKVDWRTAMSSLGFEILLK